MLALSHLAARRGIARITLAASPARMFASASSAATHEVTNQVPPLQDFNSGLDPGLIDYVRLNGGSWAEDDIASFGEEIGTESHIENCVLANQNPPVLKTHDRVGNRIDEVDFHPAYHQVIGTHYAHGQHSYAWNYRGKEGAQVARASLEMIGNGAEAGTACPLTMTFACVPALVSDAPDHIRDVWVPKLESRNYDPRCLPIEQKDGAMLGMSMTEKQGGSDVRSNTTVATPLNGSDSEYTLVGHKWFTSAPMCDGFLTLAQTQSGISCFLVPRWRPDGTRNAFMLQRLKNKLGDRSNASSEVEYRDTYAVRVGDEGRGVRTIIDMVSHTRLSCVTGSTGTMRRAVQEAVHHANHRKAFGATLINQPMMRYVLADLALEAEAAIALNLRLAKAYDDAPSGGAFGRIATAISKYYICKRTPGHVFEAMECLGGNGYVEESMMPRLFRQSPLNSIWEGSGNVICLDVLRALVREKDAAPALIAELESVNGQSKVLDNAVSSIVTEFGRRPTDDTPIQLRDLVCRTATALQAIQLIKATNAPSPTKAATAIADAFIATRIARPHALTYGATSHLFTPDQVDHLVNRALPIANA